MSGDDTGRLIYLVLLGSVIVFWVFVQNRETWSKTLQQASIWALIFLGVVAAIGLWGDIRQTVAPRQAVMTDGTGIALPRAPNGHYYATLDVNGADVRFMVDTGATGTVLTEEDARRVGIGLETLAYFGTAQTANGVVRTAPVTLDRVALGPFSDTGVQAYVTEGEMGQSLLGMSYLQRFGRLEISRGELILER